MYDTQSVTFEQVDNDTYRTRQDAVSSMPTVQVIEDVPNWRLNLLNYGDSTNTLKVDHLLNSSDPADLPSYYEDLIITGASKRFHMARSQRDKYETYNSEYTKLMNRFKENQYLNDKSQRRMKGIPEIEIQDPANSLIATGSNDMISARGVL